MNAMQRRRRSMKSLFRIYAVCFAGCALLYAGSAAGQTKNVIDYYRLLKPGMLGGTQFVFEKKGSAWRTSSPITDGELDCVVDLKNGYISVSDPGTGGGTITQEIALFLDNKGGSVIGVNITTFDGVAVDNNCAFYRRTGNGWASAPVVPALPLAQFFNQGYDPAPVKNMLSLSYRLPRTGTTVIVSLDVTNLQKAESGYAGSGPEEIAAAKKALANVAYGSIELLWSMEKGAFTAGRKLR
jgi:hypothetical protein